MINRYILSVALGLVLTGGVIAASFTAAESLWRDKMPPPAISGSIATDEKLRYLRQRGDEPVDVLAVGSSITWKHLDGAPFDARGGKFVNGGTAYLRIHETRTLTRFYLDLYPGISHVVMLSALPDFSGCTGDGSIMDLDDARAYVRGDRPVAYFYMRYFAPLRYAMQARRREQQQVPFDGFGYWMNEHGTTPSTRPTDANDELRYEELPLEPACLEALDQLEAELAARGIDFTLVLTPVAPRYSGLYPRTVRAMDDAARFARTHGIRVLDYSDDKTYGNSDFWDAFHMQWPAAKRLSREVAETLL
ncbi:hypothetical protein LAZ29_16510 [Cereibacter sphaeroides]|uniref:hypothetical protein n=1 Tax=Cereibacter sphaeroides TaxID=1063 RepID=UPI001F15D8FE|nr:hypothetical protein [Cereibacter sphaeroides]MCE6952537.1 hypothetical protein [Cereibacter sphaeroides]